MEEVDINETDPVRMSRLTGTFMIRGGEMTLGALMRLKVFCLRKSRLRGTSLKRGRWSCLR